MRKKNQEITDPKIIEELLKDSDTVRLAMTDGQRPYLLPFNYGYKDGCIYIHCAREGKKMEILEKNPHVCFEIEHTAEILEAELACDWSTLYRSVVGYGDIEIIDDHLEKVDGLEILMRSNGMMGAVQFDDRHVKACKVLKLKISEMTAKQSKNWTKHRP